METTKRLKLNTGTSLFIYSCVTDGNVLAERRRIIGHTREEGEGQPARNQSFGKLLPGFFIDFVSLLYTAWRKNNNIKIQSC